MSQNEVIATVTALLQDPALGLAAKTTALAGVNPNIRTDFTFVKWKLSGVLQPAATPNVMLRPGRWRPDAKNDGRPHRDAFAQIEIGYEFFGADPEIIQDNVALVATALAQVLDELVEYSAAHAGTVGDVEDPIDFDFGEFVGPTSHGFIARVTLFERSSQ